MRSVASLLLPITLLVGCKATGVEGSDPQPGPYDYGAPAWQGRPVSWDKLDEIERWLADGGAERRPELGPLAELELAEGRLHFARRDAYAPASSILDLRLSAAEAGFRRVLTDPYANRAVSARARAGLDGVRAARGGGGAPGALSIRPRTSWGANDPNPRRLTRNRGPWTRITVHHSAEADGDDGGTRTADVAEHLRDVQRFHMSGRGWGDLGYHFVVDASGRVWQGRELTWQGAHASGANNVANLGICVLGHFEDARPSAAALSSLERLVDALATQHSIPRERVFGHQDFVTTVCPGHQLQRWVDSYAGRR